MCMYAYVCTPVSVAHAYIQLSPPERPRSQKKKKFFKKKKKPKNPIFDSDSVTIRRFTLVISRVKRVSLAGVMSDLGVLSSLPSFQ